MEESFTISPETRIKSYRAGLRAPEPAGTTAVRSWTRFPQTWRWTELVCTSTACPQRWSRGHAGTERHAHSHTRCGRCSAHPWLAPASGVPPDSHAPPPQAEALGCLSVSGSGTHSEGRSCEKKGVWPTSSREETLFFTLFNFSNVLRCLHSH